MADKKILLVIERTADGVKKSSLELLTAASKLSQSAQISAFIWGDSPDKAASVLGNYGVTKVHAAQGDEFSKYNGEAFSATIADLVSKESPDYVISSASPLGKDLMPRAAARSGKAYISDCTDITEGPVFTKPIFAGKIITDVKTASEETIFISCRPNVFPAPEKKEGSSPEVNEVKSPVAAGELKTKFKELKAPQTQKVDLQEANIIVSGGRGMKEGENFKMLEELAGAVGAAVGASRAAVDSGYAPESMQVGQTGKTVNPSLYIACGISGAIQHLAGMRTSKVIVAVNKDADAPIFKFADYGIVGDLFKVVPAMTQSFKKLLSE